jgi:hypothetical protein
MSQGVDDPEADPAPAPASPASPKAEPPNSTSEAVSSASLEPGEPLTAVVPKRGYPMVDRQTPSAFLQDITKPITASRIAQCYVRREARGPFAYPVFHLFGYDETPLLVARNKSSVLSTKFRLIEPLSGVEIGWISSDWRSLTFEVKGAAHFTVRYGENFLGRNGLRNFRVTLTEGKVFVVKPTIMIGGEHFQDFRDIEVVPSSKNFILVDAANMAKDVVIFGKTSEMLYEMRVTGPFSLFHAFALVMTSLHSGMFHR